ncbi:unnamed protein product [Heterotrigona itama]|uniref:Uncharacterized protein n=1 Tax=Heterotrigona itama TaxID=395501 RepID=A0A6V7HGL8_9HYME|nr:unnamed protein product [Heterotrigona itama]
MTQSTKICVKLTFDKNISHSQQNKVKEFWKFVAETKPLEPYRKISDKKLTKKEDGKSFKCKRKWHDQLNVFKEHGLDKVALAAVEKSKLCYYHGNYTHPESSNTLEESYDELINDMKAFDKKSNNKIKAALT